jgi:hypothetical protein
MENTKPSPTTYNTLYHAKLSDLNNTTNNSINLTGNIDNILTTQTSTSNTYSTTTFNYFYNEQLVNTEINEDSVVFIYKALKNFTTYLDKTPYVCYKDIYKVIDNKLVKQERIFGEVIPEQTIKETYKF